MKPFLLALSLAIAGVSLASAPLTVEAKRLGGGRASGMQRQVPPKQPTAPAQQAPTQSTPAPGQAAQAQPGAAAGATAAQAGKRSWMGPIAGLAAGLGIAALMSHLGLGEAFGNFLLMALLAVVVLVAVRWFMARKRGPAPQAGWQMNPAPAGAGAGLGGQANSWSAPNENAAARTGLNLPPLQPVVGGGAGPASFQAAPRPAVVLPDGVNAADFERIAKMVFIRLQAANDAGAVDDLRKFTTPELFASLRLDLQDRGAAENHTDVVELDAELVDAAQEAQQWVASVRFRGLIREERGGEARPFDELWHLVKPVHGAGDWAIAGITPQA